MAGKLVYWDSAIFISYLVNNPNDQEVSKGIDEQAREFDKDSLQICTSVLTIIEVLKSRLSATAYKKFNNLINNRRFGLFVLDKKTAEISQEIRDYYSKTRNISLDETLSVPDAIHLATAIHNKCSRFYTLDSKYRAGKSLPLIPLSGTIANKYYIEIMKPSPSNKKL